MGIHPTSKCPVRLSAKGCGSQELLAKLRSPARPTFAEDNRAAGPHNTSFWTSSQQRTSAEPPASTRWPANSALVFRIATRVEELPWFAPQLYPPRISAKHCSKAML